jgi:hypothetical protein
MFKEIDDKTALKLLKKEATELGITFNPNIGKDKLKAKIDAKKAELGVTAESKEKEAYIEKARLAVKRLQQGNVLDKVLAKMPPQQQRMELINRSSALVRCSITCLDPSKKDVPGAIMGVRNSKVPLNKRFVPFDGRTTHLPRILVNHLKEKKYQGFKIEVNPKTGDNERKPYIGNMFSVVEMPALTEKELAELAEAQRAAGTIEN